MAKGTNRLVGRLTGSVGWDAALVGVAVVGTGLLLHHFQHVRIGPIVLRSGPVDYWPINLGPLDWIAPAVLANSFFSLLLIGVLTLIYRRERRGLPVPFRWQRHVTGGFVGAGLLWALVLLHTVVAVESNSSDWLLLRGDHHGSWIGFFISYAVVARYLLRQWRRDWVPPADGRDPERRLAGTQLLIGLAAALIVPWLLLHDLAPHVLSDTGLRPYIGYGGLTCLGRHWNDVALVAPDLTAGVTLLLCVFLHLWDRAMSVTPSRNTGAGGPHLRVRLLDDGARRHRLRRRRQSRRRMCLVADRPGSHTS
jgi:hypothetical protein